METWRRSPCLAIGNVPNHDVVLASEGFGGYPRQAWWDAGAASEQDEEALEGPT